MSRIATLDSLVADLTALGLRRKQTVMVHSSLGKVGYTVGGPVVVIRALLRLLTPQGTLVMPAESPSMSDPAHASDSRIKPEWHDLIREHLPVFDPRTTPTTMGAIPEAFRTYPGTLRSNHPLVSVCANGPHAETITAEHALEFCEGQGTPFQKLYDLDAYTRCSASGSIGVLHCTMPNRWYPDAAPRSAAFRSRGMASACGLKSRIWRQTTAFTFPSLGSALSRKVVCIAAKSATPRACCFRLGH